MGSFYATTCKTDCLQILYKFGKNWISVPNIVHQLTLSLRYSHWKIQNSSDSPVTWGSPETRADRVAKVALSFPMSPLKVLAMDFLPRAKLLMCKEWQEIWNCCDDNKLHAINPTVGVTKQNDSLNRRDAVIPWWWRRSILYDLLYFTNCEPHSHGMFTV